MVVAGLRWIVRQAPADDLVLALIELRRAQQQVNAAANALDPDKEESLTEEARALADEFMKEPDRNAENWLIRKRQEQGWDVP